MKSINKMMALIIIIFLLLAAQMSYAQWTTINPGNGKISYLPIGTNVTAVCIADYNATNPSSALHIDANALTANGGFSSGEVFRTDCPASDPLTGNPNTYWRMLRSGVEYGTIWNNGDFHFYITAPYQNGSDYGNLYFQAGGYNTWMGIMGSNGYTGISSTWPFTPTSRLHVEESTIGASTPAGVAAVQIHNGDDAVNPIGEQIDVDGGSVNAIDVYGSLITMGGTADNLLIGSQINITGTSTNNSLIGERVYITGSASAVSVGTVAGIEVTCIPTSVDLSVRGIGITADGTNGAKSSYGLAGAGYRAYNDNNGVFGDGENGLYAIGVKGVALAASVANIAVYGDLGVATCTTLPTTPCPTGPDYAGYFNGDVISLTNTFQVSDSALKDSIQPIADPMSILNQLHPKHYVYRQQQYRSMQLPYDGYGILAQNLERVLPQLVKESVHPARYDSSGNQTYAAINFKAVNYIELIPFLIGGIQQQQQSIDSLRDALANLQTIVNNCCEQHHREGGNGGNGGGNNNGGNGGNNFGINDAGENTNGISPNSGTVKLTIGDNANTPMLGQNIPNPADNATIIPFRIPQNCISASILITEVGTGKVVTAIPVSCKETHLEIEAGTIATGTYNYSLYVDGQLIDTKKMVLVK